MIAVENLTKTFTYRGKIVRAVDGVSFTCAAGEAVGIIGRNGAGKSTLFRMLATLLSADSGRATIAGHDVADEPEAVRENIGFISRDHGLYNRMTPRENIRYFGLLNGIPKHDIDAITNDVLTSLSMQSHADVPVTILSAGMRQRVSIARGIVHQPPVLILDEPLVGLDVEAANVILEFIRECRSEGQTIIFCSNVLADVEDVCDRIIVMSNGKIAAMGTLVELLAKTGAKGIDDIYGKVQHDVNGLAGKRL